MSRCNFPTLLYIPAIPGVPSPPSPTDIVALITSMFGVFVPAFSLPCALD